MPFFTPLSKMVRHDSKPDSSTTSTKKKANKKSKLWTKLTWAILIFVFLIIFGALFFAYEEERSFADSFYYIMMTVTTIGYGDITPTKTSTKWFISFYSLFGIIGFFMVGTMISADLIDSR